MDRKELKALLAKMQRTTYLNAFNLLQLIDIKFDLIVDFDTVYFSYSGFTLQIAAIHSILLEKNTLYILTKKNKLHCINSINEKHIIEDASFSILSKIKQIFNQIIY